MTRHEGSSRRRQGRRTRPRSRSNATRIPLPRAPVHAPPQTLAPREPEEVTAAAWKATYGTWDPFEAMAFHTMARKTLRRLTESLAQAGVPALVVKGALLANTVYADPSERPLRDLDLKVRPADLPRVARWFEATAGAKVIRYSEVGANVVGYFGGMEIDIESRLGAPLICALGVDDLLSRARRTSDNLGFEHWRIDPNDHALLLTMDLFKDHVGAKVWAPWDLARVIRGPDIDLGVLGARARQARVTTIVHVIARHMADVHRDGIWRDVATAIPPARPGYARRMIDTLAGRRHLPQALAVLEARVASDSRARSLGSLVASTFWRWTDYGTTPFRPTEPG